MPAIARLVERLSAGRYPTGCLHDLDRVWSRAEFGALRVRPPTAARFSPWVGINRAQKGRRLIRDAYLTSAWTT